eukprot:5606707-Prymnesium_polylepis.1
MRAACVAVHASARREPSRGDGGRCLHAGPVCHGPWTARACVANETYRRASLEPAIASICEMPELKISLCGILQPDDPSASTPTSAMPALIPRSTASARKVNAKRSCSSPTAKYEKEKKMPAHAKSSESSLGTAIRRRAKSQHVAAAISASAIVITSTSPFKRYCETH